MILFTVIALALCHCTSQCDGQLGVALPSHCPRASVYRGKVIGIAKRTKIKTDSSLIFQFLYLFFSISIPSSFWIIFPLQFPFSPTKSVFFRFPRISVPVSVNGNNYAIT